MEKVQWSLHHINDSHDIKVIDKSPYEVGRLPDKDMPCLDTAVSRNHACLKIDLDGKLFAEDKGSSNGTYVNTMKLEPNELHELHDGDELGFGRHRQSLMSNQNSKFVYMVKRTTIKENNVNVMKATLDVVEPCLTDSGRTLEPNKQQSSSKRSLDMGFSDDESKLKKLRSITTDSHKSTLLEVDKVNAAHNTSVDNTKMKSVKKNGIMDFDTVLNNVLNSTKMYDTQELLELLSSNELVCSPKTKKLNSEEPKKEFDDEKSNMEKLSNVIKSEPFKFEMDENGCIIIDSDDDNVEYPFSQSLSQNKGNQNRQHSDDNLFYTIKKEIELIDEIDGARVSPLVIADSDSEDTTDCLNDEEASVPATTHLNDKTPLSTTSDINKLSTSTEPTCLSRAQPSCSSVISELKPESKQKTENAKTDKEILTKNNSEAENCNNLEKVNSNTFYQKKTSPSDKYDAIKTAMSKETIKDIRKRKLKEIAQKAKDERAPKTKMISPAPLNVKVSNNKGLFLTEENVSCKKTKTRVAHEKSAGQTIAKPLPIPSTSYNNIQNYMSNGIVENLTSNSILCNLKEKENFNDIWDIILKIVNWNAAYMIGIQEGNVNGFNLVKMKNVFNNYSNYYSTVEPFLLLELWSFLYQEFRHAANDERRSTFQIKIEKEVRKAAYTELFCLTYLTPEKNQSGCYTKEDDVIILQYRYFSNEKRRVIPVLGYVVCAEKRYCGGDNLLDLDLIQTQHIKPVAEISFKLIIKKCEGDLDLDRICLGQTISNIVTSVRVFRSVKYLERSCLRQYILKPHIKDYVIPKQPKQDLITKDCLNESQLNAVMEATHVSTRGKPGIYLIQGPPGTGKTSVIINIIVQFLFNTLNIRNKCLLVVAPSNAAVDELVKRLYDLKLSKFGNEDSLFKLIRIGPRKAISPNVQKLCQYELAVHNVLQEIASDLNEEQNKIVTQISQELSALSCSSSWTSDTLRKVESLRSRRESVLKNSLGSRYIGKIKKWEKILLEKATIICTTLSSCLTTQMEQLFQSKQDHNMCCIVDEATQSTEQETFIPLRLGIKKLILVGDPKQLPPFTVNHEAKLFGYGVSLFSRIMSNFENSKNNPTRMLNVQYRMNPAICELPNKMYYNSNLRTDKSIYLRDSILSSCLEPYLVFSFQSDIVNSQEYRNTSEINCILKILQAVVVKIEDRCEFSVGVITPYNAQKRCIIQQLQGNKNKKLKLTVNTVDSFQGQEKDVIIVSFVRDTSNSFVNDDQRLNVSLTRAKYALYIIGTSTLFQDAGALNRIHTDATQRNLLRNVTANTNVSTFLDMISCKV